MMAWSDSVLNPTYVEPSDRTRVSERFISESNCGDRGLVGHGSWVLLLSYSGEVGLVSSSLLNGEG